MKKRIFSGIQPSGNLHLGNYLGAIKNWVKLQDEYDSIFCVVDLHAITVPQDPEALRQKTIEVAKVYLASGIDPKKCSLFIQSHVSEHAELAWILNTITRNSDLVRMTQFKSKAIVDFEQFEEFLKNNAQKEIDLMDNPKSSNLLKNTELQEIYEFYKISMRNFNKTGVGLFDYPVLMAADILLYDTNLVPVGEDQLQHIEIARVLAKRFNKRFGDIFIVPEAHVQKEGMRIMGLDDPTKKMSKSAASEYNYIALTDDEEAVRRKIKKAVTDSGSEIVYSEDKPALMNLIHIYSLLSSDMPTKDIEKKYQGKGYAEFKNDLAELTVNFLKPLQEKISMLKDDDVLEILREGAEKVRPLAKKKLDKVKEKIGFII
jgi:tryptophanyl-tRNA synthetase